MSPSEEENYRGHNGKGKLLQIHEEDMIDLGDRPFRIIDIPGHTPGSIAILDVNNRVLISGDTVQNGDIFMFGAHRNLEQYIESLKHLMNYETLYDVIYPMHGSFPVKPELTEKLLQGLRQ
jgi:glyoxylase-like metal-dependent hydrolase (beta-lactamase superfamily II)